MLYNTNCIEKFYQLPQHVQELYLNFLKVSFSLKDTTTFYEFLDALQSGKLRGKEIELDMIQPGLEDFFNSSISQFSSNTHLDEININLIKDFNLIQLKLLKYYLEQDKEKTKIEIKLVESLINKRIVFDEIDCWELFNIQYLCEAIYYTINTDSSILDKKVLTVEMLNKLQDGCIISIRSFDDFIYILKRLDYLKDFDITFQLDERHIFKK